MANSWQQPIDAEPGGGQWHLIANPGTGWLASKTAGWTADRLSTATGGMGVDFSSVVPVGTRAVLVNVRNDNSGNLFYRAKGDTEISNTPSGSSEYSHQIRYGGAGQHVNQLWLSTGYEIEIAVTGTTQDVYVAYPIEYML